MLNILCLFQYIEAPESFESLYSGKTDGDAGPAEPEAERPAQPGEHVHRLHHVVLLQAYQLQRSGGSAADQLQLDGVADRDVDHAVLLPAPAHTPPHLHTKLSINLVTGSSFQPLLSINDIEI